MKIQLQREYGTRDPPWPVLLIPPIYSRRYGSTHRCLNLVPRCVRVVNLSWPGHNDISQTGGPRGLVYMRDCSGWDRVTQQSPTIHDLANFRNLTDIQRIQNELGAGEMYLYGSRQRS